MANKNEVPCQDWSDIQSAHAMIQMIQGVKVCDLKLLTKRQVREIWLSAYPNEKAS